jgi:hypothetical protein
MLPMSFDGLFAVTPRIVTVRRTRSIMRAGIQVTQAIVEIAKPLGISVSPHRERQPERDLGEDHQQHSGGNDRQHKDAAALVDLHQIDTRRRAGHERDQTDRREYEPGAPHKGDLPTIIHERKN